jgi:hypothetical protein
MQRWTKTKETDFESGPSYPQRGLKPTFIGFWMIKSGWTVLFACLDRSRSQRRELTEHGLNRRVRVGTGLRKTGLQINGFAMRSRKIHLSAYGLPDGHNSRDRRWRSGTCMGYEQGTWCGTGCPWQAGDPELTTNFLVSGPTWAPRMGSADPSRHSRNDPGWHVREHRRTIRTSLCTGL